MSYSTPPIPHRLPTNQTPGSPTKRRSTANANGLSSLKPRGTPVGRLLASEGLPTRSSPSRRVVRKRTWIEKLQDWPSNFLLSLETSISLLSYDPAGYPIGVGLNVLHLLVRLSAFTTAIPEWFRRTGDSSLWRGGSTRVDADARLEALKRQTKVAGGWGWKVATVVSTLLVLVSFLNAAFLFTRKRKYHLMLRKDPLSSPNARSTMMDFSPSPPKKTLAEILKDKVKSLIWTEAPPETRLFPVQQLNVWTPDHVIWSLRIFSVYSPPISLMYHFLTPYNFIPFAICGGLLSVQTFLLAYYYSTLVSDRALLQSEVMHEYNAKFVNPRTNWARRDAATDTEDLEYLPPTSSRRKSNWPPPEFVHEEGDAVELIAERSPQIETPRSSSSSTRRASRGPDSSRTSIALGRRRE